MCSGTVFFFFLRWSGYAVCINLVPALCDSSKRSPHWQSSSSITLIFHNNMKNTVHGKGLMNCIFRVVLAFLMKEDEFPRAGQLCSNWCWLCQGTSMLELRKIIQIFSSLINLCLLCQIILAKTYDSKSDFYHRQTWRVFIRFFFFFSIHMGWTCLLSVELVFKIFHIWLQLQCGLHKSFWQDWCSAVALCLETTK